MTDRFLERSPELMNRDETALLVIDIQTRLLAAQPCGDQVVFNTKRLLEGAACLGVATTATEQVPEKLGSTVPELAELVEGKVVSKTAFSAARSEALVAELRRLGVRHVLIAGIETHVCVQQTALDLIALGFEPKIVVDAVGSRFETDHNVALRRLEASGIMLTTTEAALFELCETSDDAAFRTISELAKRQA